MDSKEAFDLGHKKQKYAHRNWIVWQYQGDWRSTPALRPGLTQCLAEIGEGKAFYLMGERGAGNADLIVRAQSVQNLINQLDLAP